MTASARRCPDHKHTDASSANCFERWVDATYCICVTGSLDG